MLFTEAFVVRATMHTRPDLNSPEALERITDEFVSLRNVQIFPLLGGLAPITARLRRAGAGPDRRALPSRRAGSHAYRC